VNLEITKINNTETMENLKQKILEHIADLLQDKEFELDMIIQDCKDPEPIDKSKLHLLMADASFKVFCEYFNKQDNTEQCIINGVVKSFMNKHAKHSHFWIEDGELYESYNTIRGLRYMYKCSVAGLPDTSNCPDDMLLYISKEYVE
jgi:hypothetical protein